MASVQQRFLGLCLPPLAFSALDGSLTLAGQTAGYWGGTYARVNESSPTFHQDASRRFLVGTRGSCSDCDRITKSKEPSGGARWLLSESSAHEKARRRRGR